MSFLTEEKSNERSKRREYDEVITAEWDYEIILNEIGFSKTQWILLLISGLMTITSMAAQTSIGIIAIASQCEFEMSQAEKGVMMAACVAGIVLSTYIGGYISDLYGRRKILIWCMNTTTVLQLISMFVTNVWIFNFINLIMGISLGGMSGTLYAYLSEFNTAKYRPIVINYSTMFVSITAIYVPATAWWVLSSDWSFQITDDFSFKPWRLIILCNLIPGFIGTLILIPFPESPKFLLAQGKHEEALRAINWISKFNRGHDITTLLDINQLKIKSEELDNYLLLTSEMEYSKCCNILMHIWKATVPLFRLPYGINFSIAVIVMFGLFFSSNGMQIWYPEIVNRLSIDNLLNKTSNPTVCQLLKQSFQHDSLSNHINNTYNVLNCENTIAAKTYIDNMIMGFAFLIGFSIQGILLHPIGRKNVLFAALSIGILSGVLLHFITDVTGVLILFCLYILLPGLSISIMCGAMVDLVPTQLRSKAVSMGMTLGRLGIIVASNLIASMLGPYCDATFAIVTCSLLICTFLVYFLPI